MLSRECTGTLGHYAKKEAEYAGLLSLLEPDNYNDAVSVLRSPLSKIIYKSYLEQHKQPELAEVDLVEFLGGFFLFDSQGYYSSEAASRVVGAISVSQGTRTLRHLLKDLQREHKEGRSTDKTLASIRATLWNAENAASSKKKQSLQRAISAVLGIENRKLRQVFEDIASNSSYLSPLSHKNAAYLRELSRIISESIKDEGIQMSIPKPRKGQFLGGDFWDCLREQVEIAERRLPENKKISLLESLGGFYSSGHSEILNSLRNPTDEQIGLVEKHICQVLDGGKTRPRNNLAQRNMRFENNTRHQYDIGHFLPHSAGGPPDINFFIQERSLNRGWSEQGKRYRWLESLVFSHPGTFYFVRPFYGDLSPIPVSLEWGILLHETLLGDLEEDMKRKRGVHLVKSVNAELKLAWLISTFENFDVEAIRDLRISAGWVDGL